METLFKLGGIEIINYGIRPIDEDDMRGFNISWEGKQASGEFEYVITNESKTILDTGGMGIRFCRLFMWELFYNLDKTDIKGE